MSVPKILMVGAVLLFSLIAVTAYVKKSAHSASSVVRSPAAVNAPLPETSVVSVVVKPESIALPLAAPLPVQDDFPTIDRVFQLFTTGPSKLPIVETIDYSSSVSWLKGRPAWIADYAAHFATSRHFIARSLNGKPDYFSQKVLEGSKFNVFRKDKRIQFYLLIDLSRLKMGFYYVDEKTNERVLLKTYRVGLGRLDATKASGSLTPLGRYSLGSRVAIYKPGTLSRFQDQEVEMIRIFGTRWIPFDQEVAKGYGIYGAPWVSEGKGENLVENRACVGTYETDGGIQMLSEDLEELFAIVITKPTFVEIVRDFREAKLPGIEVAIPTR